MKEETQKPKQYTQVFIKSEADLPEEEGYYFCNVGEYDVPYDIYRWLNNKKVLKRQWMQNVDWYLKEVEPVSDEDIERWAKKEIPYMPTIINSLSVLRSYVIAAAKAMRDSKIPKANKEPEEDGMNQFD